MSAAHVLVVDQDHRARGAFMRAFADAGFSTAGAASGLAAVEQAVSEPCDVVVARIPLQDLADRQFFGMVHAIGDLSVVAVTGHVAGALEAGADDAVAVGGDLGELVARVRATIRRTVTTAPALRCGELRIDVDRREATLEGRDLSLSRKEFDVLAALARGDGRVVSKRELMAEVWDRRGSTKTVDVHLSWLRGKLGETAAEPRYLKTVRGVGVRLVDPTA